MPEFHLSPHGAGGLSCDAGGAFVGSIPVLRKSGRDEWHPCDCEELSEQISELYGLPIDMSSKTGGLKAIANALNEGDVARAQIATVLLGIPDVAPLSKDARSRERMLKLVRDLHWSGLLKWDSDEHPRWPAGTPGNNGRKKGGKFAPKGEGGETGGAPTSQFHATDQKNSHSNKPVDNEHENIWQTFGSHFSHEAKAALSQSKRAQVSESYSSNTPLAVEVAQALKAYASYRAQPWRDADGRQEQVPVIMTGDRMADLRARMALALLNPHGPWMRPATNADWIDPLISMISAGAAIFGPASRAAGATARALGDANIAEASASVILHSEGSFSIPDWSGYPSNLPRPTGSFRLLQGDEYDAARSAANSANRALRGANPTAYEGMEIHEVHPIKFGGSPTDPTNKVVLTPEQHDLATTWWARLKRSLQK